MELILRLFVEVTDQDRAQRIATEVANLVAAVATLRSSNVQQYWKIPEYCEIFLVFRATGCAETLLSTTTRILGTGWQYHGEQEAIWNHGGACTFRVEEARWAQIELVK
jgi:hypothetical protein